MNPMMILPLLTVLLTPMPSLATCTAMAPAEPTEAEPGRAMIAIKLVQLDAPIKKMSLRGTQMIIKHPQQKVAPSSGGTHPEPQANRSTAEIPVNPAGESSDLGVAVITITDEATIEIGDHVLHLSNGKFFQHVDGDGGKPVPADPWKVLAAPSILVLAGQEASISVGARVPYMVQREDGSLVIEHTEDLIEGLSVNLLVKQADEADGGIVALEKLNIRISTLVGRQAIRGVPFEVGRPIIRTMEISSALSLGPRQMAIISLPRTTEDNHPIFVFLTARAVSGD